MPRFLVVDDDPDLRATIADALRDIVGFEVDEAADGLAALALLKEREYDVLITDDRMPRLSGLELVRASRALPNHPYTVVVSGTAHPEEVYASGAEEFFSKPFDLDKFLGVF